MKKVLVSLALTVAVAAFPVAAQSDNSKAKKGEATATGSSVDDSSKTNAKEDPGIGGAAVDDKKVTTTTTKTRKIETHSKKTKTVATKTMKSRVRTDVDRLQAILIGMQTRANLSDAAVRAASNEALMLANRIAARVRSAVSGATARRDAVAAANDLRMHVREMRSEAMDGDRPGAAQHAAEAMPFANRLEDMLATTTTASR